MITNRNELNDCYLPNLAKNVGDKGNELLRSRLSKLPDNFSVRLCFGFSGFRTPATEMAGELIRRDDRVGGCKRFLLLLLKQVGNSGNMSVSCSDRSESELQVRFSKHSVVG